MASSTKAAGTGANLTGVGSVAWSNPGYIVSPDANRSLNVVTSAGSNYLRASNFGFAIPAGAIIQGILVNIKRSASNNYVKDAQVKLVNASGTISGDNKALASNWSGSNLVFSYGSSLDLWGLTLTPADINDSDFGCVLAVTLTSGSNAAAYVDHIEIVIYYSSLTTIAAVISQSATVTPMLHRMIGCVASLAQSASLTSALSTYVNFEAAITQASSLVSSIKTVAQFVVSIAQSATLIAGSKVEVKVTSAIEQLSTITAQLRVPALLSAAIQQLATFIPKGSSSWTSVTPPSNSWDENTDGSDTWIDISDSTNWTEL